MTLAAYMNNRITKKERGLLKGAIRRVFSRSELRKKVLETVRVEHSDPTRARVKRWGFCPECKKIIPLYLFQVDHIIPVIHIGETLEDLSWDTLVDRIWCVESNLQPLCLTCHKQKSKLEGVQRRKAKKERL